MSLVRWEPLREITSLQKEMNRLFDNFLPTSFERPFDGHFMPAAEVEETDEAIDLKLEVPGMAPEDIDIQVSTDAVSIRGERKSERKTEKEGVVRSEFHYGQFQRVIPLSSHVQNTNVTADYQDGILRLHLPKLEEEQNKVVKVNLS